MAGIGVAQPQTKRPLWTQLYFQVLLAIVAGALVGYVWPETGAALKPLGDAFIKLVKMIIAPVIFLTVTTGIAGMRDLGKVGGVAAKAFGYFIVVSSFALVVGLVVANVVQPGAGMNIDPATLDPGAVNDYAAKSHDMSVVGFLMDIIPATVVGAFTGGNILQVLFFSIPFGLALAMIGERADPALAVLNSVAEGFFRLVAIFMRAAPIGAFGAFAFTVGKYGLASIASLITLVATFYGTAIIFVLVVLGAIAALNGFSILKLIRYLKEELLLVLGTSSSEAALPSLMEKLERAGAEKSVVGLVVPTGKFEKSLAGLTILAAIFVANVEIATAIIAILTNNLFSNLPASTTGSQIVSP